VQLSLDGDVFNRETNEMLPISADRLIIADNRGKGLRKQIMALETATAATSDILQYAAANLIGNDFLNVSSREQTAYIHTLPTQHKVRKLALQVMGIDDIAAIDWHNPPTYTANTIRYSDFAKYIDSNLDAVNAARVGIQFNTEWKGNPCYYFKAVLAAMCFTSNRNQPLSQPTRGGRKKTQGKTEYIDKGDNGLPCVENDSQNCNKSNKSNKLPRQTSIYTLGKTEFFDLILLRKAAGKNWIAEKLGGIKDWQAAGDHVQAVEGVISKLQGFIDNELVEKSPLTGAALTLDDCFNALSHRAGCDQDFQLMLDHVLATLCKIESDTRGQVLADTTHFKYACNDYLHLITPRPLLPELDLKLIKRLQKSVKGLQLGTVISRLGNGFDHAVINAVTTAIDYLASIGAVKFEVNKQDKFKSVVKLIDVSPVYGHFSGVVL
jgi:hypothetical protein